MKTITSVQNSEIKKITSLHTSKGRKEHNLYIAEGLRVLERYASAHIIPEALYITESLYTDAKILFKKSDPIIVSDHVMNKISPSITPPGIVALFKKTDHQLPSTFSNETSVLVLANITDPGNMGTLIRSAVACGVTKIIIIEGTDPFAPKVIQASAGTSAYVTIIQCSWNQLIQHPNRLPLCAMTLDASQTITELSTKKVMLVVGNEAHGIPIEWINQCQYTISLPMKQQAESFNAAVAGSIALFLLQN